MLTRDLHGSVIAVHVANNDLSCPGAHGTKRKREIPLFIERVDDHRNGKALRHDELRDSTLSSDASTFEAASLQSNRLACMTARDESVCLESSPTF